MQALILVGGEGTRLRPLTSTIPKPVVPLVDRPVIAYMLEWLRAHGVDDVVMSCGFLAAGVRNVLGDGSGLGVKLRYVEEPRPLGTGGALKFAESLLDERFFMLNGDVLTDFDLSGQLAQHEDTHARCTLALMGVEDPSAYGLVRLNDDRSVKGFLEKPSPDQIDTDLISAGAYVLERDVLELIPPDTNAWIARVGSLAVLGDNVRVGESTTIERAVVFDGAEIGPNCHLRYCILGAGARIGANTHIEDGTVLGEGVTVGSDNILTHGARIFPGVSLPDGAIRF